jgi:hypothetical protein
LKLIITKLKINQDIDKMPAANLQFCMQAERQRG